MRWFCCSQRVSRFSKFLGYLRSDALSDIPIATGVVAVFAEDAALGPLRVDLQLGRGEGAAVRAPVGGRPGGSGADGPIKGPAPTGPWSTAIDRKVKRLTEKQQQT